MNFRPHVCRCFLVFAGLLIAAPSFSSSSSVGPVNGGFERLTPDGGVVGWALGSASERAAVQPNTDQAKDGVGSLQVAVKGHGSATVVSESLKLQVGHLYRLSAWIRTEGAVSDATAKYPTAVPACLTMASFPFTNHTPTVGSDSEWTRVETLFIATTASDRVRLHLGYNGSARGTAWFDDVAVEKVEDITEYIPMETVRWFGEGFRYDDRGWIFVHIEGEPYERGYQYGALVADEIAEYIRKLGTQKNQDDPAAGWETIRFETDAIFLRSYDEEYLREMRGIADGAAWAEAEVFGRELNFLDIVAVNSVIDLGQLHRAMAVTPHSLTGESFLDAEEEILISADEHKCSAFAATGPATADGEVVFGQIFMWSGYTGVHWNVICDLDPSEGHRLVYHTFPGGIHSGADFYLNEAGIVIGETTVQQTPFEPDSTPQSNRIRKAAQYAGSIDEVAEILWHKNNGMYTNDWPIADVKTGEVAILLLGTHQKKLWRTSEDMAPFGTPGFLWANNNNRDPEVRKEYVPHPEDRPFDLIYSPWNRDVAFNEFYDEHAGSIDAIAGVNLWASSPINRAHACDGKITTSEMAREMVFLAHFGKVTLREKFPAKSSRAMPDLPGATPHLSLGYSVASPIFVTDKLKQARDRVATAADDAREDLDLDVSEVEEELTVDPKYLWRQTVYPASEGDNWFISASAAYWRILRAADGEPEDAARHMAEELGSMTNRYLYTVSREEDLEATAGHRAYDRYGPYLIPRIKGTFCLHQLRLLLGNEVFLEVMRGVHERFAARAMSTAEFIAAAEEIAGRDLDGFIRQWIDRPGLPELEPTVEVSEAKGGGWDLSLGVLQSGRPYRFTTHVEVTAGDERHLRRVAVAGKRGVLMHFDEQPTEVVFNVLDDVPVARDSFYTWRNFVDDFHSTLIVYGTSRQIEANHTLARRFQETLANAYVEILPPLVKDSELSEQQAAEHDLIVLGSTADNQLLECIGGQLPVKLGRNFFEWQGERHADSDDGLFMALPNPFNPDRVLYLFLANSALELHEMTKAYHRGLPSWARFEGDEVVEEGFYVTKGFEIGFGD